MDYCDACGYEFQPEQLTICSCGAKLCMDCYFTDHHDEHDDED